MKFLLKVNPKAAESLADPSEYPNLFEDWQVALAVESNMTTKRYPFLQNIPYFLLSHASIISFCFIALLLLTVGILGVYTRQQRNTQAIWKNLASPWLKPSK
jgi:hypothetical protein